jgi:hypothetical protein
MAKVTLVCPNLKCKSVIQVGEEMRGQRVRCKRCDQIILVPPRTAKRS